MYIYLYNLAPWYHTSMQVLQMTMNHSVNIYIYIRLKVAVIWVTAVYTRFLELSSPGKRNNHFVLYKYISWYLLGV